MITSAYDAEQWRKFHELQEAASEHTPMKAQLPGHNARGRRQSRAEQSDHLRRLLATLNHDHWHNV